MKRLSLMVSAILLALFVVACGSASSAYTTTGSGSTAAGGSTPATTGSTPAATQALIHTTTATVDGKSETILTNAQGMTLYYFKPDTATQSACSGGCAGNWPPVLTTGATLADAAASLPGKLSVATTANGSQVEYNGHPLYTYVQDTAAGQTTGQNVGGKWFVATPDLASQGGTGGGSGYGY